MSKISRVYQGDGKLGRHRAELYLGIYWMIPSTWRIIPSKGTPVSHTPGIPTAPNDSGIPNHKLLVEGRFGMFQGYVGKFLDPQLGYVVNNHGEYISPLRIGLGLYPFQMAELHCLYKWGLLPTTY